MREAAVMETHACAAGERLTAAAGESLHSTKTPGSQEEINNVK